MHDHFHINVKHEVLIWARESPLSVVSHYALLSSPLENCISFNQPLNKIMAHKKKGLLTTSPEWAKHLRKYMKNQFWRGEREAEKKLIRNELEEMYHGLNQLIDEILWTDWDPIGIKDVAPRDEYQACATGICSRVLQNRSANHIANKLYESENEIMGVNGSKEYCLAVANKIMNEIKLRIA